MRYIFVILISILLITSCDSNYLLDVPSYGNNSLITETQPLSEASKYSIEGIYKVFKGNSTFGDTLVIKSTGDKFSIFGVKDGVYAIMDAGSLDSLIFFEGYWRQSRNSNTGLMRMLIRTDFGGSDVMEGDTTTPIIITGTFGFDGNLPDNVFQFRLLKRFTQKIRNDKFFVVGHRGGGRTSDRLPHSENSIPMIGFSKYLGCNGVEIDIKLTKDRVPVLYHDANLNIRLIEKSPIYGPIENYTYNQLETFVRLIKGERIPTLQAVLLYIVNQTELEFVWLDMKDANALPETRELQKLALKRAEEIGRDIKILIGMPSQDVYDAVAQYQKDNNEPDIPTLCELEPQPTFDINADAWGPRWTMGTQADVVSQMHDKANNPTNKYIDCLVWTLDVPRFIEQYIEQGRTNQVERFDGILTNYPTIVAYFYYVRYND